MAEPPTSRRVILSVIGPHSGCGKTSLIIQLLRHLSGLGCLKISPVRDPHEVLAGGPESTEQAYWLEEPASLSSPGKDTALYLAAGSVQVERLRHRRDGLARGLKAALQRFPPSTSVVVESSRAVRFLKPAAVIMVVRPPVRTMKPSTVEVLPLVTDLLVNVSKDGERAAVEAQRLRDEFSAFRPQYTWAADLSSQPPPEELIIRLRSMLAPRRLSK
jgi:molybdopterin-guanine dinucleotide biosynthesis protein